MKSSITHNAEIESFICGKEYGAESIVVDGQPYVLAIMQKWMTDPPYYAELGHAIPTDLKPEVEARAKSCVYQAIKALGINYGSVNMDILITSEGNIHIVDIGARMGGNLIGSHIVPAGTGIDYMKAMIQNAVGDPVELVTSEKKVVATKLLALTPGTVVALPDVSEIEEQYGVLIEHHMFVGMKINEYHTNLDGCGYIVAVGKQKDLIESSVKQALCVFDHSITRAEE
jgi:biotin carboxylase